MTISLLCNFHISLNFFKFFTLYFLPFLISYTFIFKFTNELKYHNNKYNSNTYQLTDMSLVIIKNQTYTNSKYFSRCNHEWHNVLLKCLYHSVNYEMSTTDQNTQTYQMQCKQFMCKCKSYCCKTVSWYHHVNYAINCHPFVNLHHHLCWLWFIFRFYFCLKIW